jgi:hypothetical protein
MEPQAEETNTSGYDVIIPDKVKYCPYNGTYQDMINRAYEMDDKKIMKALIEYRDHMINRNNLIIYPEQLSHTSGATVN